MNVVPKAKNVKLPDVSGNAPQAKPPKARSPKARSPQGKTAQGKTAQGHAPKTGPPKPGPTRQQLANLDSELLALSTAAMPDSEVRERFRKLAIVATAGIGSCHVIRDDDGDWDAKPSHATGRVPRRHDFVVNLGTICEATRSQSKVQMRKLAIPGTVGIFAPINVSEDRSEILLVVVAEDGDLPQLLMLIERIAGSFRLWLSSRQSGDSDWKISSLAKIIELSAAMEKCDDIQAAANELTNTLAAELKCGTVALAALQKKSLRLKSLSGANKLDKTSETAKAYLQALMESRTRGEPGLYPVKDEDDAHLLLSHKRLLSTTNHESVYSQPLISDDGVEMGAWLFTGPKDWLHDPRFGRFVAAASPRIASSLVLLERAQKNRLHKFWKFLNNEKIAWLKWAIPIMIFAFALLMMMPVVYRVRCNCLVEPVSKRFAVAPFEGLIVAGYVKPGDIVEQDQLLAEIDGRTIRWELTGIAAERKQSLRQREIELVEENVPAALLAELENKKLAAREKILKHRRDHLSIRSPIAGVVLSGSLEDAEAASIQLGQVLFEIGPLSPVRIEIAIPAIEMAHIRENDPVTIWIEGQENEPVRSNINRIYPRSELRDARNVFVAEIEFDNEALQLRPGMKGGVRIDSVEKPLGWVLFHKPMNYLRSRLTWW